MTHNHRCLKSTYMVGYQNMLQNDKNRCNADRDLRIMLKFRLKKLTIQ
jgi:hypothetical protein